MRARYLMVGGVVGMVLGGWWWRASARPSDGLGSSGRWNPTAQAVRQRVGPGGGMWNDARHLLFAELFTERYRLNEMAVRAHYDGDHLLGLQCAATIPRWQMAQLALQLHDEARACFGEDCRINIFETYITIRRKKVAELTTQANGRQKVFFDPRFFEIEQANAATRRRGYSWPPNPPSAYITTSLGLSPGQAPPMRFGASLCP